MKEEMNLYICKECGHEIFAFEKPLPIKWTDGHVCSFELAEDQPDPEESDNYGYAEQGKSFD